MATPTRLLLVGHLGGTHVGDSFAHAAGELGLTVRVEEIRHAFAGPRLWRVVNWRLLGRRPSALGRYNRRVRQAVIEFRPHLLFTTGVCPVTDDTLAAARAAGAATANYSTDDPWNPTHLSHRFLRSLPGYDVVFSPRQANRDDFLQAGAGRVEYLPFAYDPRFAYPVDVPVGAGRPDVLFVGGGDPDRLALLGPVLRSGLRVALHGGYWDRHPLSRSADRGLVGPDVLRRATAAAKVNLCLVRRSNRDGHVMRSFEIPAIGGCVLAEDTPDHRAIFADTALYFSTPVELAARATELVADPVRRANLATAAHARVTAGGNTYRDRLSTMLAAFSRPEAK